MEMCRACLSTEKGMHSLDETFVLQYNLLTNLDITLLDGMPQYACKTCLETVKQYIEFREKSIASEDTLRQIVYPNLKFENKNTEAEFDEQNSRTELEEQKTFILDASLENSIKYEIKEEENLDSDTALDNFDVMMCEEYGDNIHNLVKDEDMKSEMCRRRTSKRVHEKKASKVIQKNNDNDSSWIYDIKSQKFRKRKSKRANEKKASKVIQKSNDDDYYSWICGICPNSFEEENDLNMHLDLHKNDRQCGLCKEKVNSLSQLLGHRLTHVSSKQLRCHICRKRYKAPLYLEHHYRNAHIEDEDPKLSCKICSTTYSTPKKLTSHILNVHSGEQFFCDYCSKSFSNKFSLKSHIRKHLGTKSYVCDLCGFSCKYSGGLKDHKIRKHAQKKIICKNCSRPFSSQEDYDKHQCKKKLQVCTICGLQITGSSRLSSHMVRHSNIFKYECERCPAKYKSRAALNVHYDRHDGNRTKQCEFCPAKFYSAAVLIKHRRTHTGEKPYVCKVCNKGFTGGHNLKVHMKVHGEYLIIKKYMEPDTNILNSVTK